MHFIADNMLGKLAKWLRFLGYDVLYPKNMDDDEIIQFSLKEDRYILTRDKELAKRKGIKVLYIPSDQLDEQLTQVINEFNLELSSNAFIRCPECNFLLNEIAKSAITTGVPKGVLERQDQFWVCKKCNRYYWQGTHYDKIKKKLDELF
ncbi:Mut7-C RNAse domain-containing protein [[Eubacterium] cellulosolvens]